MPPDLIEKKENKYDNTIYKSSYWFGQTLMQLFVNFGYGGHNSFSFVTKKGAYTFIYNLVPDEKVKLLKNMIGKLTPEEKTQLLKEI